MRWGEVKGWLSEAEVREVGRFGGGDVGRDMMSASSVTYDIG